MITMRSTNRFTSHVLSLTHTSSPLTQPHHFSSFHQPPPLMLLFYSQKASQACKEALDKKFGPTWNVCIGEGFGYEVKYNARHMILIYYGEKIGILAFKV